MIYKLLFLCAILLIIACGYRHYIEEKFENEQTNELTASELAKQVIAAKNEVSANQTVSTNLASGDTTVNIPQSCKPSNWWEEQPIKAIRSKLWGASYNLIHKEDGNILTPVLIPIQNPSAQSPTGCLSINPTGWHESAMCSEKNVDQRWIIKKIGNQDDFVKAIEDAKQTGDTTGFTYGYKMDKVDYPFFIIVAKEHPSQALYYNGSALGVRPIGNYDDQKWDILKDRVKDPIITNEFNYYSKLTPELQTSQTFGEGNLDFSEIQGFQKLMNNNPQAIATLLSKILQQPNEGGAMGVSGPLKINIEMDDAVLKQLTDTKTPVVNTNTVVEAFTNQYTSYKDPLDINVTLNYAIAKADQSVDNQTIKYEPKTITLSQYEIGPSGELIKTGDETVSNMNMNINNKKCDDTICYPNMNDWIEGTPPCIGCVKGSDDWSKIM